ncbi:glycosyltransferase family A protein [Bacillus sp. FJAT-26390]|uniref:glycosyltransferase family 2 protein n=1 Tax=Bacillus sp. FJAT-26390 TaxID=1743142 RepID=UPI000807E3A7|nr:glycosyltransferase family A protein [Bacillus sp. FJAT-26390]OBZ11226.1 hypothetical protein A7975_19930 [Bacillus sp. FJAT-26390]
MISIIIPLYNGEEYIGNIINCFSKQLYKNFELVFVNDGSTDDSYNQLLYYKERSGLNVTIINQVNQGVSAARNIGIKESKGDYLCFCDVDDLVEDTYLYDMYNILNQRETQIVFCKHKVIKAPYNQDLFSNYIDTGHVKIVDMLTCLRDFLYGRLKSGCCTIMVSKEILLNNHLQFAEGFKYSEDLHMLWRIIANCNKIAYLDKTLYKYLLRPNSATSKFNEDRFDGYVLMKELEVYFESKTPDFSSEYKKYGAAKLMWSIVWQASNYKDRVQYNLFIRKYNIKNELKKLITFNNAKVAISSFLFIISPLLFKILSSKYGAKFIH